MHISVFRCLDFSSKPIKKITINEALSLIKDHPLKARINEARECGKCNKNFIFPQYSYTEKKVLDNQRNLYDHIKSTEIWSVTWNCVIKTSRAKSNIDTPTGYIYCDVDDFTNIIKNPKLKPQNIEEAQEYIYKLLTSKTFKFIKGVWRSFGNKGFGFLVEVEDLNIDNFTSTWEALESLFATRGITIDPATKDITRPNVLSYDPNIFIREDEDIKQYAAVEPEQKVIQKFQVEEMPAGLINDVLSTRLKSMYANTTKYWTDNRLSYKFWLIWFTTANKNAIDRHIALDFLKANVANYPALFQGKYDEKNVIAIMEKIHKEYFKKNWGDYNIEVKEDEPEEKKFTVTNLHQVYEGDYKIQLQYTWFNLRKKDYNKAKKIHTFAFIVKQQGIIKEHIYDFFSDINYWSDNDEEFKKEMEIISKVYGDTSIHFGIVKELTAEAIEASKMKFAKWAEANNIEIRKIDRCEEKVQYKLETILTYSQNRYPKISDVNIFSFLGSYYKEAKSNAISSGVAYDFLKNFYSFDEDALENMKHNYFESRIKAKLRLHRQITRYAKFLAPVIYNYEPWKFGLQTRKCLTLEQVKANYNIVESHFVPKGQYISDLDLKDIDNKIIWANTSMGKTTWICEHMTGHRLILVPIIPLLEGIQLSHKASVFYQTTKDIKEGDELIVCTYSSFPALLKIMEKWNDVKVSDYRLFFDEYHNFAVSADKSFRGYELNIIADNMHVFKSRTMLTGTMFDILHPVLKKFEISRITWENVPPKLFKRTRYQNILYSIEAQLSRDGKNVIYLQNKKDDGKLGELIDYLSLKGWDRGKIWCINADEKNSDHFKRLIANKRIDDDIDIVICTSVIVEGVDINNEDIATIHFMTHEGLINAEQLVNRFRKVYNQEEPTCMIYTYKKIDDTPAEFTDQVDVTEIQKHLISMSQHHLEFFSTAYVTGDSLSHKITQKLFLQNIFRNSGFYRNNEGTWDVDYLSIANMAYTEEKKYSYQDLDFTKMMLSQYNWVFVGENTLVEDLDEKVKTMLKDFKADKKAALMIDVVKIMDEIRQDGEELTLDKISDKNRHKLEASERPSYEIGLRVKVKWLSQNMTFNDACNLVLEWVQEHAMSDRIWTKITRQVNVQIALKSNMFDGKYDVTSQFASQLIKFYTRKKKEEDKTKTKIILDASVFVNLVKKHIDLAPELKGIKITEEVALDIVQKYFDITQIVENDKIKYYLKGIIIANDIVTFSIELEEWAKKCKDNEVLMSSQELTDKINSIREKLPILGMYHLNSKNGMRLIHDYFEFEQVSKRSINGKKINVYQFGRLIPKEISQVTIKPMLKVDPMDKHPDDMTYDEKQLYNHQRVNNALVHYITMGSEEKVPF